RRQATPGRVWLGTAAMLTLRGSVARPAAVSSRCANSFARLGPVAWSAWAWGWELVSLLEPGGRTRWSDSAPAIWLAGPGLGRQGCVGVSTPACAFASVQER